MGITFIHIFFMPSVQAKTEGEYLADRLNEEAVEFIRRNKSTPLLLYLSHYAIHTKLAGKLEKVARYKLKPGAGTRQNNPELAARQKVLMKKWVRSPRHGGS